MRNSPAALAALEIVGAHDSVTETELVAALAAEVALGWLEQKVTELNDAISEFLNEYCRPGAIMELRAGPVLKTQQFRAVQGAAARAGQALGDCAKSLRELAGAISQALDGRIDQGRDPRSLVWRCHGLAHEAFDHAERLQWLRERPDPQRWVHLLGYAETNDAERDTAGTEKPREWVYQRVPIEVGQAFRTCAADPARALVLTSATLTVGGSPGFLAERLGLDDPEVEGSRLRFFQVDSPFDHSQQSALVVVSHLPPPARRNR